MCLLWVSIHTHAHTHKENMARGKETMWPSSPADLQVWWVYVVAIHVAYTCNVLCIFNSLFQGRQLLFYLNFLCSQEAAAPPGCWCVSYSVMISVMLAKHASCVQMCFLCHRPIPPPAWQRHMITDHACVCVCAAWNLLFSQTLTCPGGFAHSRQLCLSPAPFISFYNWYFTVLQMRVHCV